MDPAHLDDMIRLESTYWWHVSKHRLVDWLVRSRFPKPGRLIEGGIGAGGNLLHFQQLGFQVTGFDVMAESVEHVKSRGVADVRVQDLCTPWPVDQHSASVILLLDVIEHLIDPVAALKQAKEALSPSGGIIVTVPAYPSLYGPWDKALGHYRRYTWRMLREHTEQAGLKLSWCSFWNSYTLPIAWLVRLKERMSTKEVKAEMKPVNPIINNMLIGAGNVERMWMRVLPVPCGLSLVGVLTP